MLRRKADGHKEILVYVNSADLLLLTDFCSGCNALMYLNLRCALTNNRCQKLVGTGETAPATREVSPFACNDCCATLAQFHLDFVQLCVSQRWGDQGFIKIMKDTNTPGGLCGVAMQASYPTAAGASPAVTCNPHAKTLEACPDGKPCPPSGKCGSNRVSESHSSVVEE